MKRYYIRPNMEITAFEVEDIITQSDITVLNSSMLTDEDADIYEMYMKKSTVQSPNASVFTW